jgi:hypothetical protein
MAGGFVLSNDIFQLQACIFETTSASNQSNSLFSSGKPQNQVDSHQ